MVRFIRHILLLTMLDLIFGACSGTGGVPPRPSSPAVGSSRGVGATSAFTMTPHWTGSTSQATGIRTSLGHAGPVTALAWSPDGTILASSAGNADPTGRVDSSVRLWSATGVLLKTLERHAGSITSLAWSPDGRLLASGSRDKTVRLWSAAGMPLVTLDAPAGQVFSIAWSPDGRTLAVGSVERATDGQGGVVRLFHPDGTLLATLSTDPGGGKFLPLGWAPNGGMLAAGAGSFRVWRADGTLVAAVSRGGPTTAMAWSSDSHLLATGDESGTVELHTPTGQLVASLTGNGSIVSLLFAPGGATLAVLGAAGVRLVATGDPRAIPRFIHDDRESTGGEWSASNLVWSPDGGLLAGRTPDGHLHLWHADGTSPRILAECGGRINVLAWSPDGQLLAGGASDGTVCLWRR